MLSGITYSYPYSVLPNEAYDYLPNNLTSTQNLLANLVLNGNNDSTYTFVNTSSDSTGLLKYRNHFTMRLDFELIYKDKFTIGFSHQYSSGMANIDYAFVSPIFNTPPLGPIQSVDLGINRTLNQLNTTKNIYNNILRKYDLLVDLSEIEAYFLKDIKSAKEHLNKAMSLPSLKARLKANAKLKLADILVYEDNIWEASLMYKQIEKEFKSDAIGHQAKFKNAQVYYFSGEYDWCQAQLDVLKASTSKLIANDALELSVLITDNYNMDTSETPMKLFSYADMLSIQQQYDAASKLYDSILNNFQNHSLNDEIIFRKAKISLRQHKYHEAVNQLIELVKNYPSSILLDNSTCSTKWWVFQFPRCLFKSYFSSS